MHTVILAIAIFAVAGCATGRLDYTSGKIQSRDPNQNALEKGWEKGDIPPA